MGYKTDIKLCFFVVCFSRFATAKLSAEVGDLLGVPGCGHAVVISFSSSKGCLFLLLAKQL